MVVMMMMWTVSQPAMTTRHKALQTTTAPPAAAAADDDVKVDKDVDTTNDITKYQPLTLAALMDYKKQLAASGRGQFALRHVRLWPIR